MGSRHNGNPFAMKSICSDCKTDIRNWIRKSTKLDIKGIYLFIDIKIRNYEFL